MVSRVRIRRAQQSGEYPLMPAADTFASPGSDYRLPFDS
jgi:hypothetical protein